MALLTGSGTEDATPRRGCARARSTGVRLLLAAVLACVMAPSTAWAETAREYPLKAAFLLNFLRFVDWPTASFPDADTPIRIGILGEDPFGASMDDTVRGETAHNRSIVVQRAQRVNDLADCQLIFVSRSETAQITEILASLSQRAVLTVSDIDQFAKLGGMIDFYPEGRKVRFEINPTSVQQQNLKMSAQLLSLGKIVATDHSGERK